MSQKRWKEIPKEHRDTILNHLKRAVEFCRENDAPKSAAAYEAAFSVLDKAAQPTLREKLDACRKKS